MGRCPAIRPTTRPANGDGVNPADSPPSISVILLAFNGEQQLPRTLPKLLGQQYGGNVEIVAVDSSPGGETARILEEYGLTVHSIAPDAFHHARTRNFAAAKATGDVLVFLSQDAEPANAHWLAHLLAPFDDPGVGAVYGRQIPPEGIGPLRRRAMESLYPETREIRRWPEGEKIGLGTLRFSNANSAVRRSLWEAAPFPPNTLVAEDHWMCYAVLKAGWAVAYAPEAAVHHGHERSLWGEFRWALDNGASLKRMGVYDDPDVGGEFRYGLVRAAADARWFLRKGRPGLALGATAVSVAKWLGVQIGKRERLLPRRVLESLSPNAKRFDRTP